MPKLRPRYFCPHVNTIWPDEDVREIIDLYKKGWSFAQLERRYHAGHKIIRRLLRQHHVPLRITRPLAEATIKLPTRKVDAAYIAGMLDGEGYVGVINKGRRNAPELRIDIASTNREVIDWLAQWGGIIHTATPDSRGRRTTLYNWRLHKRADIALILRHIRPYLIIKAKRADEVLAFLKERHGI